MAKKKFAPPIPQIVPVHKIFLDQKNPRHDPYKSQSDVIEYLCRDQQILALARDIVDIGPNPLELFALLPASNSKSAFIAAEGNRRLCAIKLLNDPDLAPPKLKAEFATAAEGWSGLPNLLCIKFSNRDEVDIWLERIHGGEQRGTGRRQWNAEQKARHFGSNRNATAQALLDYAVSKKMLSAEDRKGKITTVTRFEVNPAFREALGIERTEKGFDLTRPEEDFTVLLRQFINDLLGGKDSPVTSRRSSDEIKTYARNLSNIPGQVGKRVPPSPPAKASPSAPPSKTPPKRPAKPTRITFENEIDEKLFALGNHKLKSIYYSLSVLSIVEHAPLLTVGAWTFLESLTGLAGRDENTDFLAFLDGNRLTKYGYSNNKAKTPVRAALKRISENGNATKHHKISANFDGVQLANDMDALKQIILCCADEAAKIGP